MARNGLVRYTRTADQRRTTPARLADVADLDAAAPEMTEAQFTRLVIEVAHLFHWRVAHFRPSLNRRGKWQTAVQGDGAGFLDLVLCNGERVIFAELKTKKGRLTAAQYRWFDDLKAAGQECYVWRPEQFREIERVLRGT